MRELLPIIVVWVFFNSLLEGTNKKSICCYQFRSDCLYPPVQAVPPPPPHTPSHTLFLSQTEELVKADTCARDRHALQQHALNEHIKHSDLTWPLWWFFQKILFSPFSLKDVMNVSHMGCQSIRYHFYDLMFCDTACWCDHAWKYHHSIHSILHLTVSILNFT